MVVLKRAHGAEAAGVFSREFGAKKKHLGRIVCPYQYDDERACSSVCIGKTPFGQRIRNTGNAGYYGRSA
jgi:hypothetical protein